jgi:hypothetical protein
MKATAVVTIAIDVTIWMTVFWDVHRADMVCDNGQDPSAVCSERFITLNRSKGVVQPTDIELAR